MGKNNNFARHRYVNMRGEEFEVLFDKLERGTPFLHKHGFGLLFSRCDEKYVYFTDINGIERWFGLENIVPLTREV